MFKWRLRWVKERLHRSIEEERVGDEGGEVVGEDRGDDDGPRRRPGATGSKGERAPLLPVVLL